MWQTWEAIELRDVRVFLTVAEELHFGRSAERLGLTQSRVSQVVRGLEERVGVRLFDRTSRRVALTPAGERLRARLEGPYGELLAGLAAAHAEAAGPAGRLRLGILVATSGGPHLVEIVRAFEARHPGCAVELVSAEPKEALGPLRAGEIDLLAVRLPAAPEGIALGPVLARDARVLAVATSHRLAGRETVSLEDLADETLPRLVPGLPTEVQEGLVPATTPSGRVIPRTYEVTTLDEILAAVARGVVVHPTVATLPDYYGYPGVTYVPFADAAPSEARLAWRADRGDEPLIAAFAAVAGEVVADADP